MQGDKYLVWSFEHKQWWRSNRCGYTSDIDAAGRYSKIEAGDIVTDSILCEEIPIIEGVATTMGPPKQDPYGRDGV